MKKLFKVLFSMALVVALLSGLFACVNGSASAVDGDEPCEPRRAWTEIVNYQPEWTENVHDHWQRWSWTGGPHASDDPPAWPGPGWQPNVEGDPHGIGQSGPYYRSNGNSGNGDWFYLQEFVTQVWHPATWDEVFHPEITCEDEPPTEDPKDYCDTVDGVQDADFNCPPADNPDKPIRSQKCVGNDLVVTVTYPNGNLEHYNHPGAKQCTTKKPGKPAAPVTHASVGTPQRLASAPEVEVVEEGM